MKIWTHVAAAVFEAAIYASIIAILYKGFGG